MFRDNLDDYETRKDASRQTPAPVDAGLVERMRTSYHNNSEYCDEMALSRIGMTAALRVAADVLLANTTPEEVLAFRKRFPRMPDPIAATFNCYIGFRRARILAADLEMNRVSVGISGPGTYGVWLDGEQINIVFGDKSDAEIYRLGLVAKLKQEGK